MAASSGSNAAEVHASPSPSQPPRQEISSVSNQHHTASLLPEVQANRTTRPILRPAARRGSLDGGAARGESEDEDDGNASISFDQWEENQVTEEQQQDDQTLTDPESGLDQLESASTMLATRLLRRRQRAGKAQREVFCDNSIKTSKYTASNFVAKSLFEQFKRLANIYFLVLSALMMLGTYAPQTFDSPLTPYSTFFPLCVVLGFTMIKEAFEDRKRHASDKATDNRSTRRVVCSDGDDAAAPPPRDSPGGLARQVSQSESDVALESLRWHQVRVGHVLRVRQDEAVPADLVVVRTSNVRDQTCYVETSNIDGETNLKMRRAVTGLFEACGGARDESAASTFEYRSLDKLVCEPPNGNIHAFQGFLKLKSRGGKSLPVDETNVLLRGSSVQNVSWVDGYVVYTGKDTKLAKNANKPRLKLSSVEKTMNRLIWMVFGWLFVMVTLCDAALAVFRHVNGPIPYLHGSGESFVFPMPVAYWFTFLILFSNALPMSLYVTVEMVNFGQAFFIDNDILLYDQESNTRARAVTSNLNSDLGQVEYLFSDKTGTLTQNVMSFRRCSVEGKIYGDALGIAPAPSAVSATALEQLRVQPGDAGRIDSVDVLLSNLKMGFLTCLAVAHTVVTDKETGEYRAESPDEKALCEGAKSLGATFVSIENSVTKVRFGESEEQEFEILAVNEFSSARKRMSVLARLRSQPKGSAILFVKGADSVILPKCERGTSEHLNEHLAEFANEGLRTLVLAGRVVSSSESEAFLKKHREAKASVGKRDELLEACAKEIEKDFTLYGATAIEDKLQEGVPETLEALRAAGIKIWLLTGDKLETAVNIGFSAKLLTKQMGLVKIQSDSEPEVLEALQKIAKVLGIPDVSQEEGAASGDSQVATSFLQVARARMKRASAWWAGADNVRVTRRVLASDEDDRHRDVRSVDREEERIQRSEDEDEEDAELFDAFRAEDGEEEAEEGDEEEQQRKPRRPRRKPLALALTGAALRHALESPRIKPLFLSIALACRIVLACRVSPSQKADVVRLVKRGAQAAANYAGPGGRFATAPVTLAIGDGANDVAMIQEAQIGVGISGHEGLQAVNASDFAIAQFRFLRRLLLVHGRWSYRRMAKVVLFSIYKNLVLILVLFYYQPFAAFSGVSLFESMTQAGFNFFLGMSPLAVGLFDREISARFAELHPQLYVSGRRNLNLNPLKLGWRVVEAFVHSSVIFLIPFFVVFSDGFAESRIEAGGSPDLYVFGTSVYTSLVFVCTYKILFEASSFTRYNALALAFSAALYFSFLLVYTSWYAIAPEFYHVALKSLTSPVTWLLVTVVVVTCFVFDASVRLARLSWRPHPVDIFIERDRIATKLEKMHERRKARLAQDRARGVYSSSRRLADEEEAARRDAQRQHPLVAGSNSNRPLMQRVQEALDPNHAELLERVNSLTEEDLTSMGIDSPSLRSSFDFSSVNRLRPPPHYIGPRGGRPTTSSAAAAEYYPSHEAA